MTKFNTKFVDYSLVVLSALFVAIYLAMFSPSANAKPAPRYCQTNRPVEGGLVKVTKLGSEEGWGTRYEEPGVLRRIHFQPGILGGVPAHYYFKSKIYNTPVVITLFQDEFGNNLHPQWVVFYAKCESL